MSDAQPPARDPAAAISLAPLDPEEALRALLAVEPDAPPAEDEDQPDSNLPRSQS